MTEPLLAAVLFTDLVGSTALRQDLTLEQGHRVAREFMQLHERMLHGIAAQHSALTVKWEGDGIMAAFPSAASALDAACAAQRWVRAHNDHPDRVAAMTVRIGVAAGDVVLHEGEADGAATVEAKRLCDRAGGGEILCTDLVALLARGSADHRTEPYGELVLKGFERPVSVLRVDWADGEWSPAGLPDRLRTSSRFGFAGRSAELTAIRRSWTAAVGGQTRLVLVAGDAGIGKSRLAAQAAREVTALGATVLYGACDPNRPWPYRPFAEALRGHLAHAGRLTGEWAVDAELGRLLTEPDRQRAGLPPLDQGGTTAPGNPLLDPASQAAPFYESVTRWLAMLAAEEPVIVVIDDLGWADEGTIDLLTFVVEQEPRLRLQFVATLRDRADEQTPAAARALPRLDRTGATDWLMLGGLAGSELEELVGRWEGLPPVASVDPSFYQHLAELSHGIPFYACEIIGWLEQNGTLADALGGRWPRLSGAAGAVPRALVNLAEQRLRLIDPAGREPLRTAAVIGRSFELPVLTRVTAVPEAELHQHISQAVRARIVDRDLNQLATPSYLFTHDLLRESLLTQLSPGQTEALHVAIGEAMDAIVQPDQLPDRAAEIARHLAHSPDRAHRRRAVELLEIGAVHAVRQAAPAVAARLLGRAVELTDQDDLLAAPEQISLRIRYGIAQRRSGIRGARRTLLEAGRLAGDLGDPYLATQAALANTRGTFSLAGDVDRDRVDQLRQALALLGPEHTAERASLLAGVSQELTYHPDRAEVVRMSVEALGLARSSGDGKALMRALAARHSVEWNPDGLAARRDVLTEWLASARAQDEQEWLASATSFAVQNALESGDRAEAEIRLAELEALNDQLHQPALEAYRLLWSSVIATLAGELATAEHQAMQALEVNLRVGNLDGQAWILGQIYPIRWHQGRLGELEAQFSGALDMFPGLPVLTAALANIRAETGRPDDARATLGSMTMDDVVGRRLHLDQLVTVACLVRVAHLLHQPDLAATLEPLLVPYLDQHILNGSVHFGSTYHYLALTLATLGRVEEADGAFARALAANEALGAPLLAARTRQAWADLLAAGTGPNRERAQALAAEAVTVAEQFGAAGIADDARAVLGR